MWQSFPPPNYTAAPSAVEGIEVYKPVTETAEDQREIVHFTCPQCGGTTAYSAKDGGLTCTNCGYLEPPKQAIVGKSAEEFEFTVDTFVHATRGWGDIRKELQCQGCGAYTSLPQDSLTHTCPFCDSNKVIQHQTTQDVLRPRFLIPFKVETEACHQAAKAWLGSSWMTPGSLKRLAKVTNFNGIYLPFWTFDAVTRANWQAEVGHTKHYTDHKGNRRSRTVWKWESGRVQLGHNDVLLPGTRRVSALLLEQIQPYNLHQLAPYEPSYLAGYQAQAHDISLEKSWEVARHQMREYTRNACRDQASSSKVRNFSMEMDFDSESWRYILLPVYLASYVYRDKSYQVIVNGQTGTVAGQRPVDWLKVWLVVVALLAPGLLLGVIGVITMIFGGVGFLFLIAGFLVLTVGLVINFQLVTTALRMDDA
jgi:hypothetical protein